MKHDNGFQNCMTRRELLRATLLAPCTFGIGQRAAGRAKPETRLNSIPALRPREAGGHQFVVYGDCCSGIAGTGAEKNFASVNRVLARLKPQPEFLCFLGDHIAGGTEDYDLLRREWHYWLNTEMAWLDHQAVPIFHTTSNHNTYDKQSEAVWREVFRDIPRNGPPGQEGLSYYVRRGNLLLVAVNTNYSGLGGGRVESSWLDRVLAVNSDAAYKLVLGHYPAHPVNGYELYPSGWRIVPEDAEAFWKVLVKHRVQAYLCSHIIAFDVQVHEGVLQILTGGAGTNAGPGGFMPGRTEYLHAVQMAVDRQGLCYQVLDPQGEVREWLGWPLSIPPADQWAPLEQGKSTLRLEASLTKEKKESASLSLWRFSGLLRKQAGVGADSQTLLCGWDVMEGPARIWIGLEGAPSKLVVRLLCEDGDAEHTWIGPSVTVGERFDFQVGLHTGMGPGGILSRPSDESPWSSLKSSSAQGAEDLKWAGNWAVGRGPNGSSDRPFQGENLRVAWTTRWLPRG